MTESQGSLCFTCGQPSGPEPRLNSLANGRVCPTCRDRLLESLPSILPSEAEVEEAGEPEAADGSFEALDEPDLAEEAAGAGPRPPLTARKGPGQLLRGHGPVEPA